MPAGVLETIARPTVVGMVMIALPLTLIAALVVVVTMVGICFPQRQHDMENLLDSLAAVILALKGSEPSRDGQGASKPG